MTTQDRIPEMHKRNNADDLYDAFATPSIGFLYEGPPINKGPGVNKPPPGGPLGAPRKTGGRYQHFEEIVGALRAQIFRSEKMHIVFQRIFEVFASGASKSG